MAVKKVSPAWASGVRVSVKVPATSANLGAGFDTLGVALALYDEVEAHVVGDRDVVRITGEGADVLPQESSHLIVRTVRGALAAHGVQPAGIALKCRNRIPQARGLGSSAAAIVAGHAIAQALLSSPNDALDKDAIFAAAAAAEGHPDNVAPCVFGGLTVAWQGSDGIADCVSLPVDERIAFTCVVPQQESSTKKSRSLLPEHVEMRDAVFNISRASAMVVALSAAPELLFAAMDDRLHEKQRRRQWPSSYALVQELRAVGVPAAISGAGSSVLVAVERSRAAAVRKTIASLAPDGARVLPVKVDPDGVQVTVSSR